MSAGIVGDATAVPPAAGARSIAPAAEARANKAGPPQNEHVVPDKRAVDPAQAAVDLSERVRDAASQFEGLASSLNRSIRFRVLEESDQVLVEVVDASTDEVVRTIPSEEMLEHAARLEKVLGMILDTDA